MTKHSTPSSLRASPFALEALPDAEATATALFSEEWTDDASLVAGPQESAEAVLGAGEDPPPPADGFVEYAYASLHVRCQTTLITEDDAEWLYVNVFDGGEYLMLYGADPAVHSHYLYLWPASVSGYALTEVTAFTTPIAG